MNIEGLEISASKPPLIIGEVSGNHNNSLITVKKIIKDYADVGGKLIKFQTFTADTMTIKSEKEDFQISTGLGKGYTLYDLFNKSSLPWEWHTEIFEYARSQKLIPFSSPFDKTAVDFLETLNVPAYKIASYENIDIPLIEYAASKRKPIIISSGMSNLSELYEAYKAARNYLEPQNIGILKCTSCYPASVKDSNISTLEVYRKIFPGSIVGLSDHTIGLGAAAAATSFGANIIEKHIFDTNSPESIDAPFAMDINKTRDLICLIDEVWNSIGSPQFESSKNEQDDKRSRRSLYFTRHLKQGHCVQGEDIKSVRPGYGLSPRYYSLLIGKKVTRDIEKAEPVKWDAFLID